MSKKRRTNLITPLIFVLSVFLFLSCVPKENSLSEADKKQLTSSADSLLTDWHKAASEAHFDNYFGKMDSVSIFIGTDASENWSKTAFENFSRPYFDKGKAWNFSAFDRNIYTSDDGNYIWFDELLSTWMGICRGSGVIENKNNELKIKHYVLSVTVPNDDIQKLIAIKKEKDSIFENGFSK